jgi:DNA-binding GntR family transcriptional regulator
MKKLVRAKSLSEQVSDAICSEIETGRFALGQMLSETMIATRLGVSRTPVREAFSHLEQRGLVITQPKKGTFVFDPDQAAITDLFDVCDGFETNGLRLSARHSNSGLLATLESEVDKMDGDFQAGRELSFHGHAAGFRRALVSFSESPLLVELYEGLSIKLSALSCAHVYRDHFVEEAFSRYRDTLTELSANKLDAACARFAR